MAGNSGGPARRSHTKSRRGCKTCKRRHIRCDETVPQCRNCTKHGCRCDYMDAPPPTEDRAKSPKSSELSPSVDVQRDLDVWQETGVFPFPELQLHPEPSPHEFSLEDLRLLHHICMVSRILEFNNASRFSAWAREVPTFLRLGVSFPFMMHSVLALSATHLAWVTKSAEVDKIAYRHRGIAFRGLQGAIGSFSKANSDAVLGASIILSWQAPEWRGWAPLMQGISSVIVAMRPWRHESHLNEYIAEQAPFYPGQGPNELIPQYPPRELSPQEIFTLDRVIQALESVDPFLATDGDTRRCLQDFLELFRGFRVSVPSQTAPEQFRQLYPMTSWSLWLPVSFLQAKGRDVKVMVMLAHFYAAILAIYPLFSGVSLAYFTNLHVICIEDIFQSLTEMSRSSTNEELKMAVSMMGFPCEIAADIRHQVAWMQPQESYSMMGSHRMTNYEGIDAAAQADLAEFSGNLGLALTPVEDNMRTLRPPPQLPDPSALGPERHLPYLGAQTVPELGHYSYPTMDYAFGLSRTPQRSPGPVAEGIMNMVPSQFCIADDTIRTTLRITEVEVVSHDHLEMFLCITK